MLPKENNYPFMITKVLIILPKEGISKYLFSSASIPSPRDSDSIIRNCIKMKRILTPYSSSTPSSLA
jgi:hypothetical protein